eukprot:TRINITY_DN1386_c0_g1_i1.p2 TRINITY_DN1386_c0_g1~~TRINITY_DN1386_c0_g1_i1.p2  ORF type:complete len:303 (+),score=52.06 TRINITY_DN1386_c0_g1_i1:57-911(+)
MQLIFFALFIGSAIAGNLHYGAPAIAIGHAPVVTKSLHTVARPFIQTNVHNVVRAHAHTVVDRVNHPAVTKIVNAPTTVLAKAPRISGYRYTSEVNHNAAVPVAAPVAHVAAPVAHAVAAPVAKIHAAPVAVAAAPVAAYGTAVAHHAAVAAPVAHAVAAAPVAAYGTAVAHTAAVAAPIAAAPVAHAVAAPVAGPIVQKVGVHAAPVAVREPVSVSSYGITTGRIGHTTQVHYAQANIPAVAKVAVRHAPVVTKTVHAAPVVAHAAPVLAHAAPIAHAPVAAW